MIRRLLSRIFGKWCDSHGVAFYSDFCPQCIKAREYRMAVMDTRPEWIKSEGSWPTRRGE